MPTREHRRFGGYQKSPHSRGLNNPHKPIKRLPRRDFSPSQAEKSDRRRDEQEEKIPPIGDNIRVIPLGGVEEIGRNMIAIEYKDDIVILDMGFQFKEDDTPGIDYLLPNTKYIEERKDKVKAVFITHGHLDHIGGIPYIMPRIGNPTLYSRALTTVLIKKRQEEFPHLPPLDIKVVENEETIKISDNIQVSFFAVTHTIPDSMGIIVHTPYGGLS